MRKVAFFDIDGTLFRWQLYHELIFELKNMEKFSSDEISQIDRAFLGWQSRNKPWREYENTIFDIFEKKLTDISLDDIVLASKKVVERSGHKIHNYTFKLLKDLQKKDYFIVAISGSGQGIVEAFAKLYDIDKCIGHLYEIIDGKFSGKTKRYTFNRKAEIVREVVESENLTLKDSIAIGDSYGDIGMLELVDNPIAFNPSKELLETAQQNGWKIVIDRKDIAYTLENQNGSIILAKTDEF
ncbi:hypothetical protein CR956_01370 [Candidatus Saccharibacteria bacterium]|nr:MAG: hypothetical protein CR956_01370 [Candidatus Saccharibacteria bacterium]